MVLINYATKEIVAKVVYYGPALCGKTTNLQHIYTRLNPKKRGKMIALATESDRTLFFDFLPMELGKIQGFKVRFQLYTVPGQVFYGATRRLVLKGADAVVFVADSQEAILEMNRESVEDMKENLRENNLDPETIPLVFQYNKRDLNGIMEVEDLERELNWRGAPHGESVAITGPGVMESFMEITRALIADLKKKHSFMDTDAIKELPPEIFQQEEPEQDVLEAEDVVFEIEHGSGYHDESGEEEVVAGEMLDMVETISLTDSSMAEEFFDDVRKGIPTEELKEKVLGAAPDDKGIELSTTVQDTEPVESLMPDDESITPVGERHLTPEEIEFEGETLEEAPEYEIHDEVLPEAEMAVEVIQESVPAGGPAAKGPKAGRAKKRAQEKPSSQEVDPLAAAGVSPEAEKRIDAMQETLALLAKDVSTMSNKLDSRPAPAPGAAAGTAQDKRIDAMQETLALLTKDISAMSDKLDSRPAPAPGVAAGTTQDKRIDAILETQTQLAKDISALGEKLDMQPASASYSAGTADMTPELSDIKDSLGRIEQEISALRLSLTMMKESVSNAVHTAQSGGGPESSDALDELKEALKTSFEGQDRLLLSILEAARVNAQANTSGFEKLEDALRYIAGSVKDEKGGKKKWL